MQLGVLCGITARLRHRRDASIIKAAVPSPASQSRTMRRANHASIMDL